MKRLPLALALWLAAATPALAVDVAKREVLLLYSSRETTVLSGQNPYTAIELVLHHLGLLARYHDLAKGLPSPTLTDGARGVVALLQSDTVPNATAYARWLVARTKAHQPVVLLGAPAIMQDGVTAASVPKADRDAVFAAFGLRFEGDYVDDPRNLELAVPRASLAFERPWDDRRATYTEVKSTDAANDVFLRIRRQDTNQVSDMGLFAPAGAVVLGLEHMLYTNSFDYHQQWRIDPFRFFERALGTAGQPRLDPTTINGRRAFYAHIDGDGFANVANMPGRPLAAEVVRDQVLKRTTLPTTVSVIARELVGKPKLEAVARSLFAMPNVAAGSHSYTHPFNWTKAESSPEGAATDVAGESMVSDPKNRKGVVPLTPRHELDDSFRYIQTLLPAGKQVGIMLWSGACNPPEPYLAQADALHVANMNGGDAALVPRFPSYANLAPLGRLVGDRLQVLSSVANENIFTNLWTGPFDGQQRALDTMKFAESPRRISAVNIYYHFYSGERPGGVRALRGLYQWAASQPLAPIHAATYAGLVADFFAGSIVPDGPAAWRVPQGGACRTVRFDAEARGLDWTGCQGVVGANRTNGALYVHLAPGPARIALALAAPTRPHLAEASAPLVAWDWQPGRLVATFDPAAPLTVVLGGFAPGQVVQVRLGDGPVRSMTASAGMVRLTGPARRARLEALWLAASSNDSERLANGGRGGALRRGPDRLVAATPPDRRGAGPGGSAGSGDHPLGRGAGPLPP